MNILPIGQDVTRWPRESYGHILIRLCIDNEYAFIHQNDHLVIYFVYFSRLSVRESKHNLVTVVYIV